MCSEIIREDLKEIVRSLMEKRGISDYKLQVEGRTEAGDNYMGEILFLNVVSEDGKIHHMVVKTAKTDEQFRKMVPIESAYKREIAMYSEIFPAFQQLLKEANVELRFDFVPELLFASAEPMKETLILNNLKSDGYKMLDRTKPWNLEHSLFVIKHYGKFHAFSMALKYKKPELFAELTKNLRTSCMKEMDEKMNWKKFFSGPFEDVMQLLKINGRDDLIDKYEGFVDANLPIMNGDIDDHDKLVLFHGDGWNNNFMFKYKDGDESKPSKMCILDFQLSSLGTPILDLSYNIYTSCDKSGLKHLDLILKTYYKSLSESLQNLGCDPGEIFTYDQLMEHWRKYSKVGVCLSLMILRILLTTKEDVEKMLNTPVDEKMLEGNMHLAVKDMDELNRRVLDIYIYHGDNFL